MRILLLQDHEDVREKVVFFIEGTYGAKVEEVLSIQKAAEILATPAAKGDAVDLVVFDFKVNNKSEVEGFWKACGMTPVIRCIQGKIEDNPVVDANVVGFIYRPTFVENLVSKIDDLIERGVLKAKPSEQAQCRIRTKLLLAVAPLKGDIYIKLSDKKFVKLFKEGDTFNQEDLEKYTVKKGIEYLYIRQEQIREFTEKYRADLAKMLQSDSLTVEDVSKMSDNVHETVKELSKHMGFTKEVQELAKAQVQLTMKSMGKSPKLADILRKLKETEGQFIATHSTLTGYLACAIAAQLQWGSDTTFHKLTLASFLHDISLDNQELAHCLRLDEVEKEPGKYTSDDIKAFKLHPNKCAEIAKGFSEVPPDVDTIIVQHHERPDGTGFPRGLNQAYIAPLAAVFIVAHDLAHYTLKMGDKFNPADFIKAYKEQYKSSQFKKILSLVEVLQTVKGIAKGIAASKNQA